MFDIVGLPIRVEDTDGPELQTRVSLPSAHDGDSKIVTSVLFTSLALA